MLFTAKFASFLFVVAASARAAVTTSIDSRAELAELSVIFFDDVNFTGPAFALAGLFPAVCNVLPGAWLYRAESVIIDAGYTCTFSTVSGCEGAGTALSGSVASLPNPPLYNNIEAFLCTKNV